MVDKKLYTAALLMYEAYNLTKDSNQVADIVKISLLEMLTHFVNLNLNEQDLSVTVELDNEINDLINELKEKGDIDNVSPEFKNQLQSEWNNMNPNFKTTMSPETEAEINKIMQEISVELSE